MGWETAAEPGAHFGTIADAWQPEQIEEIYVVGIDVFTHYPQCIHSNVDYFVKRIWRTPGACHDVRQYRKDGVPT